MVQSYPQRSETSATTRAAGFTLIEMMVSISMGLVLLAGLTTIFVSMSNTSRSVSSRGERMSDLYLASQIMQSELRESQKICIDKSGSHYRIIYQPLDSDISPDSSGTCNTGTINNKNGSFEMRSAGGTSHPTPYICWKRPKKKRCEELIRNFYHPFSATGTKPFGLVITSTGTPPIWTITFNAKYTNKNKYSMPLSLRFKTWSRN